MKAMSSFNFKNWFSHEKEEEVPKLREKLADTFG